MPCAYAHILRPNAAVEDYGSSLRAKRGPLIAATCPDVVWLSGKVNAEHCASIWKSEKQVSLKVLTSQLGPFPALIA